MSFDDPRVYKYTRVTLGTSCCGNGFTVYACNTCHSVVLGSELVDHWIWHEQLNEEMS